MDYNGEVLMDVQDALPRVGNMLALYKKLINSFLNDKSYDDFKAALAANDIKKMQFAAHTVKGIAANLSLKRLFKVSYDIDAALKNEQINQEAVAALDQIYLDTRAEAEKYLAQ